MANVKEPKEKPVTDMEALPNHTSGYKTKPTAPIYTISEFADNSGKLFGVRGECAIAALRAASITECTVSKAKEIIKAFMEREVK